MLEQKTGLPKSGRHFLPPPSAPVPARRQQRLMLAALILLLASLVVVLYRDRDFWFPESEEAAAPLTSPPEKTSTPSTTPTALPAPSKKPHLGAAVGKSPEANDPPNPPPVVIANRTVLPPLEVEVVAGDAHRTLRTGSNAVHVDLQNSPSLRQPSVSDDQAETTATMPTNAAERSSISDNAAAAVITRSVQPEYPMLARQMKVQGSVILQALIGRDGLIQDLRVLSGPPILATAAREAVKQWHFKPHYVGAQAVETRTNITVNFTISTN